MSAEKQLGPGLGWLVAVSPSNGAFLGWFHLRPGRYWPQEIEVGCRLRRAAWGQALAAEGTRALIGFAFGTLHEPRVIATTMAENTASRRVIEQSGMNHECDFEETRWTGDGFQNAVKYSVSQENSV